jgi:lysozyme family protein
MRENFAKALAVELTFEGGDDDDPIDPGGRTRNGITQRVYTAWLRSQGRPNQDVFKMTPTERDAIYRKNYFDKVQFDDLPPGVDLVIVDGAINSGVTQSIKWVQRALGLTADGVLGVVTMQRIQDHPDHDLLIRGILQRREAFLRALKTFYHFGKGWMSRVNQLLKKGQAWAMGSVGPEVSWVPNGNKKANLVDAKTPPLKAIGDYTASGGMVTTGLSTVQSYLEPLSSNPLVGQIITGLVVAGVVLAVVGFAYRTWAARKESALADVLDLVATQALQAENDNADLPREVLVNYVDPNAKGSETGNIAPGAVTTSGRKAGDTEERVSQAA